MGRILPHARHAILAAVSLMALQFGAGCKSGSHGVVFQPKRSVNLAVPQKDWPGKPDKALTLAQREVYESRGAPDFIRFLWKGPEEFAGALDVPYKPTAEILGQTPQTWVYRKSGDEVSFESPVTPVSKPISDKLAVVILEGDPEARTFTKGPAGEEIEVWRYYSSGLVYKFDKGKLIRKERQHDPISGFSMKL